MGLDLTLENLGILLLFVFPGLVSAQVYRLIMPSRPVSWADSLIQSLFYTAINFAVLFPLVPFVIRTDNQQEHPAWYWLAIAALVLIAPVIWPFLLRAIFRARRVARWIQVPYPTPWDYFFDFRRPIFLLVTLNSGSRIGGFWGPTFYAGSFPNDGDIYLEAVYDVDEHGKFGEPKKGSRGVLIRRDQYTCVELFAVPHQRGGEEVHEQGE